MYMCNCNNAIYTLFGRADHSVKLYTTWMAVHAQTLTFGCPSECSQRLSPMKQVPIQIVDVLEERKLDYMQLILNGIPGPTFPPGGLESQVIRGGGGGGRM